MTRSGYRQDQWHPSTHFRRPIVSGGGRGSCDSSTAIGMMCPQVPHFQVRVSLNDTRKAMKSKTMLPNQPANRMVSNRAATGTSATPTKSQIGFTRTPVLTFIVAPHFEQVLLFGWCL